MQLKIVVVACVLSMAGRPVARRTDWARGLDDWGSIPGRQGFYVATTSRPTVGPKYHQKNLTKNKRDERNTENDP
jgi:hypothetical protein